MFKKKGESVQCIQDHTGTNLLYFLPNVSHLHSVRSKTACILPTRRHLTLTDHILDSQDFWHWVPDVDTQNLIAFSRIRPQGIQHHTILSGSPDHLAMPTICSQIIKNTHHSKPLRSVLSLISQATWCKTYSTFKSKVNLETRTWLLYSNSILYIPRPVTTRHYPTPGWVLESLAGHLRSWWNRRCRHGCKEFLLVLNAKQSQISPSNKNLTRMQQKQRSAWQTERNTQVSNNSKPPMESFHQKKEKNANR